MAKARRRRKRPLFTPQVRWLGLVLFIAGIALGVAIAVAFRGHPTVRTVGFSLPGVPDPLNTAALEYVWADQPAPLFPVPPYARHLRNVRIVLDPGHVGQRDKGGTWKRGPTGLREAEANLAVAFYLREFLQSAGADVLMTREVDRSLNMDDDDDLRDRAEVANRARADLFLSIHHNGSDDPNANYTSLFYHDSPQHSNASVCAAVHIAAGLQDALRLDRTIDAPVLNDRLLYNNGLAVLRFARVPAVLSEASFHSNPAEEARLRDPIYNRREAYGMFLGLARWAQGGLPRVSLVSPADGTVRGGGEIVLQLDDGLRSRGGWGTDRFDVQAETIRVALDGDVLPHTYDAKNERLTVTIPRGAKPGGRMLRVDFQNAYGQHVLHPFVGLDVRR